MLRLIRWLISTIFTIIVVAFVLYFFKFTIRGDALCISLRHSDHKRALKQVEYRLKQEVEEGKRHLTQHVKSILTEENSGKERDKNSSDEEKLRKIIKDNMR